MDISRFLEAVEESPISDVVYFIPDEHRDNLLDAGKSALFSSVDDLQEFVQATGLEKVPVGDDTSSSAMCSAVVSSLMDQCDAKTSAT